MNLTEAQEGAMNIAFRIADDEGVTSHLERLHGTRGQGRGRAVTPIERTGY